MKKLFIFCLLISTLFIVNSPTFAQHTYAFLYSGQLLDIDANPISNKNAVVNLEFSSEIANIYNCKETILTNSNGKFLIILKDIPILFSDQLEKEKIEILISFSTDEDWLEEKEFSVKYFLNKIHNQNQLSEESIMPSPQFEMSRFEGQDLSSSTTKNVYKFSDNYPFAYLSSTFMISTNPEYTKVEEVIMVTLEADKLKDPSEQDDSVKTRGIKSGYAVGGYNKKTKKD